MINDRKQEQSNEAGSTGYQAGRDLIVSGVTYFEARQIALDLWKANALELSQDAAQLAMTRVNEFMDSFLIKLNSESPALLSSLKQPGMQMAVFEAQKQFAKSGDKYVADLLEDFLIQRAGCQERSWTQIVVDEALAAVPRLTTFMMYKLSAMFLANQALLSIKNFEQYEEYILIALKPIVDVLFCDIDHYAYLKYLGCAESMVDKKSFFDMALTINGRVLYDGIPLDEFHQKFGYIGNYREYLEVDKDNTGMVKFVWSDFFYPNGIFNNLEVPERIRITIDELQKDDRMNAGAKIVSSVNKDFYSEFQLRWINSPFVYMTTTLVGALIGQAHLKRYAGIEMNALLH